MSYDSRRTLLQKITEKRNRPLISYVTSIRAGISSNMASDVIPVILDQIEKIPRTERNIDFLIVSNGGDPITAMRIISLLRERFDSISVLLPYVAYSAATILALGADEIIMHPYSNLGPIDPQLTVTKKRENGEQISFQFSSEDLRNYIEYIKNDIGIKDQELLAPIVLPLINEVGTLPIGSAKRSQQLSLTMSERMLGLHSNDMDKAKEIATKLNSSYFHHGYPVGRSEAKSIGLNISEIEKDLEDLLWCLWKDYENEMKCNESFSPDKEILSNKQFRDEITKIPVIELPSNTPQHVAQKIVTERAQKVQVTYRTPVEIEALTAIIESINFAKAFYVKFVISHWRDGENQLKFNYKGYPSDWTAYKK